LIHLIEIISSPVRQLFPLNDFFSRTTRPISTGLAPPCVVTFSWWGGLRTSLTRIAMLDGVFILLLGPPKPDRLKD